MEVGRCRTTRAGSRSSAPTTVTCAGLATPQSPSAAVSRAAYPSSKPNTASGAPPRGFQQSEESTCPSRTRIF